MNHRYSSLLRCILAALACAPLAVSAINWEATNRHPLALKPSAVHATAEAYWIGGRGFVASSPDGVNWTTEFTDASEEILAITDWNGAIVIGTRSGKIYYRADSESTWSEASLARFGYDIVRAEDGRGFRGVLSDVPKPVNSLKNSVLEFERNEDRIVALTGDYATTRVGAPTGGITLRYPAGDSFAASTDLENWTELHESPEGVAPKPTVFNGQLTVFAPPDHFAFGNGVFVTLGGSRSIWTSVDGLSWERSEVDLPASGLGFDRQIFFYNGHWLASGQNGSLRSLLHSTDLVNWEEVRLNNLKYIYGFAGQPGKFLVWGRNVDDDPVLYRSENGIDWRTVSSSAGFRYRYVDTVDGPAGFLAMEVRFREFDIPGGRLLSADGSTWANLVSNPEREGWVGDYHSTGNAGGWFFYSVPNGGIFASPNGQDWTLVRPTGESGGGNAELQSVAYLESAGKWIVLTTEGQFLASTDGISWATVPIQVSGVAATPHLFDVVAFGDAFYAISRSSEEVGMLVSSIDGLNWSAIDGPSELLSTGQLLASSAGMLVRTASERYNYEWSSTDGRTWKSVNTELLNPPDIGDEVLGDTFVLGEDFAVVTRRGEVRLWSPDEGLLVVRPRTDSRYLRPWSIAMTDVGNYVVLADNEELAIGPGLQWLKIIPTSFEGGLYNIGVVNNIPIALTMDATYSPILAPEDHWNFMGQRFDDWVNTLWFGWLYDEHFPWVYHQHHGWIYQAIGEGDSLWNWDSALGVWTWTDPDTYPWIYFQSGEHAGWVYFERQSQTPHRWFFVHASQRWETEADFQ